MSKNKRVRSGLNSSVAEFSKIKLLIMGAAVGLGISLFALFIITAMNKSHVVRDAAQYHPATFHIAEMFMCGCPECEMELLDCKCNHPSGGAYEIYFISEMLSKGLSEKQVSKEVFKKFGKIKNHYRHLLNG